MVRPYSLEGAEISSPPNRFPYEKPWFLTSAVRALLSVCYVLGLYFLFFWKKKLFLGNSLIAQGLGFHTFTTGTRVRSLIGELRSCELYNMLLPPKKKIMFLISLLPLGSSGPSGRFNYNYRTMPYYRAPNKTRMLIVTTTPHKS